MAENQSTPTGIYVLFAAAAAMVIGPFLPWMKATAPFVGTLTKNGVENGGDGLIVVGLGIVVAVCALIGLSSKSGWIAGIPIAASLLAGAVLITDTNDIRDRFHAINADGSGVLSTSYGAGLYLVGLSVILGIVGALMVMAAHSDAKTDPLSVPFTTP